MSKHTAGPWRHEIFSGTDHEVRAGAYLIARVYSDPGTYTECNARLIAAAPELLEACKALLSYDKDELPNAIRSAKAAIAKAEGLGS